MTVIVVPVSNVIVTIINITVSGIMLIVVVIMLLFACGHDDYDYLFCNLCCAYACYFPSILWLCIILKLLYQYYCDC